jgi:predicted RNA-binding protein YlxR (DUF448 family)
MSNVKKIPLRTCTVCRAQKGKNELFRIVKTPDGKIVTDEKANGRGAYICKTDACIDKAQKEHRLEKALKCAVPPEIYDKLKELLHQNN